MHTLMKKSHWIAAVTAVVAAAGCGSDALGPDTAQGEGFVSDAPAAAATYSGTAAGDFQVSFSSDGQTWIDLGSLNGITVTLQDAATGQTVHGQQVVPEGTFNRVRLIVQDIEFTVAAGGTVGGVAIGEETKADLASGAPLSIERAVQEFTLSEGQRVEIRFDLNSEVWLTAADLQAGVLPTAAAEAGVTVSVQVL